MDVSEYLHQLKLPAPNSHKGQNGKLLIIGGSDLFHAAGKWSLDVASKFVDMVFYSSVPSNNELIQQAKGEFWNGIVIDRSEIFHYIDEADCVLIGPGMTRSEETETLTNDLLKKYPHKRWVIDAGALQMADPKLFKSNHILTPHPRELEMMFTHLEENSISFADFPDDLASLDDPRLSMALDTTSGMSYDLGGAVLLIKGVIDFVAAGKEVIPVAGGNAGMTKGGTGDVLAGLVAALYCTNEAVRSAVVGSYLNKKAGEYLWQSVGPNFNASDLVDAIPKILWQELQNSSTPNLD